MRRLLHPLAFALLAAAMGVLGVTARAAPAADAGATCNVSFTSTSAMARLAAVMATGRWVTYTPTSLQVVDGQPTTADPSSLRADLTVLRSHFDGLITYTATHGAEAIPGIAATLGYRAVIVGVWDPFDDAELNAALALAKRYPRLVVGVSLGNEMVFAKRHGIQEMAAAAILAHRRAPELPISSTEPFHVLYGKAARPLLNQLDFLLVNVHPVFQPWFRDAPEANSAQFVVDVVANLADDYCGPVLVKETGIPTSPPEEGFSEARQASFYGELQRVFPPSRRRAFAYFSAFDAPWRATDSLALPPGARATPAQRTEEAHWGLYDAGRHAKPVMKQIPPLP